MCSYRKRYLIIDIYIDTCKTKTKTRKSLESKSKSQQKKVKMARIFAIEEEPAFQFIKKCWLSARLTVSLRAA